MHISYDFFKLKKKKINFKLINIYDLLLVLFKPELKILSFLCVLKLNLVFFIEIYFKADDKDKVDR